MTKRCENEPHYMHIAVVQLNCKGAKTIRSPSRINITTYRHDYSETTTYRHDYSETTGPEALGRI